MFTISKCLASSQRYSEPDLPPPDFDPDLHPILARHWFGIYPHGVSALWWSLTKQGVELPAEHGVILIEGGR